MPAASYREGPDGHSSRKQNSKRRRAKCSPSFVSGRVIGHGDIPPRCVPECSAMALHRAVPRCSPQPRQHSVFRASGGDVLQVLPSAPFFCGEGGSYLVRGESRRSSMARSSRMRFRATGSGNIPPRCVPGRQSVASFALHASQKRPRTGKSPVHGRIFAPCIRKRAPFGKICAPCIRKAPQTAFRERTARRSCQEGPLFAARAPRIMHGAQILPSAVASNRPSARNTGAAEQCEPPELDRPAQETQPRRQRPRRLLGSKYRQQLPRRRHRSLPTPASSLSPRRTTLSSPTAPPVETASTPPPPRRFANLRSPKGRATFPACGACLLCSWQMRSAYKRQAEPLLRDYFVMVA